MESKMLKSEFELTGERIADIIRDWAFDNLLPASAKEHQAWEPLKDKIKIRIYTDEDSDPAVKAYINIEIDM
jgi:hypothetical protein